MITELYLNEEYGIELTDDGCYRAVVPEYEFTGPKRLDRDIAVLDALGYIDDQQPPCWCP